MYHLGMSPAYRIRPERVSFEIVENEALIIDLDSGNYFTTAGVGCFIWQLLDAGWAVDRICDAVAGRADGPSATIAEETRRFIRDLEEHALISPISAPLESEDPALDWAALEDWDPPLLEAYTDMQELLLIDPIHDVDEEGWPIKADPEAQA